jgi:putative hemolysin
VLSLLRDILTTPNLPVVYISAAVIICVAAFFFAFFSIMLPRTFAERMADRILIKLDWILQLLYVIFKPFELAVSLSNRFLGLFIKENPDDDVSEEEILKMVDAGGESGSIDEDEKEMINNIFEFDDKTAVEVATHRKDIVALSVDASLDEILNVITTEKYSRIPIYKDSIDDIVGILHVKDVMNHVIKKGKNNLDIKKMLMKPFFVPFTKKADELFEEMQDNKIHICIVVDEYGGTAGIVTMEDLIEEVMGNILDEYDEEEQPEIAVLADNNIRIDGATSLDDVAEQLGIDMPLDEYETIGGFVIGQLGNIPEDGDTPQIEYEGYKFNVDKVEDKRIISVTVTKEETVAEEDNKN